MPEIKIKHIASFSSEDKIHKAENLLKDETYRKWKCASPGAAKASINLQFEKATKIHSIDIGNEHSAFVEVLVGRASDSASNYQVLLVTSSFMSPLESRNSTSPNRVRMFGPDKLAQNVKDEKWDCAEIVCTQPFNKNVQYGLTFVKFHSPPDPEEQQDKPSESDIKIGAFKLKNDADANSSFSAGTWFSKRKDKPDSPINSPAAIRQASSLAAATLDKLDTSGSLLAAEKKRHAANLSSTPPSSKKDSGIYWVNKEKIGYKDILKDDSEDKKPVQTRTVPANPGAAGTSSRGKADESPVRKKEKKVPKKKPFNKIMEKVLFTISGFQNPLRSQIRDCALEMGAKYKGDWDPSCTHLVCAFINTPKYVQVHADNGRIVTKEWILDCHKMKELLPWRTYMLGKYSRPATSEEDSSDAEEPETKSKKVMNKASPKTTVSPKKRSPIKKSPVKNNKDGPAVSKVDEDDDDETDAEEDYMANTDVEESSGGDTEDEIRKVQKRKAQSSPDQPSRKKLVTNAKNGLNTLNGDILDGSKTKEEKLLTKPDTKNLPLPELPNFFKGRQFFLYGDFSETEKHDLERYVTAYNGHVANYMGDQVKYVVTKSKWNEQFEEALSENEDIIFVQPKWVLKCHQSQKFVPFQPYIVVPDE